MSDLSPFNGLFRVSRWRSPGGVAVLLAAGLLLGGCAAKLVRVSLEQRQTHMLSDLEALFSGQEAVQGPLTIHQAMARAIHYNLESRVQLLEVTLAQGLANVSRYDMLPKLAATAGYTERDPLPTDTQDLFQTTANLTATWNVLDFGVSFISSRQQADRIGIAAERRRKAAHNLIRDVRNTFWRALAAQQLQSIMPPLMKKVTSALASAREAEEQRLQPPLELLDFQKNLLKTLEQLQGLSRQLSDARIKLAALVNLPPGQTLHLVRPAGEPPLRTDHLADIRTLEQYALLHRPELYERDYNSRIKADETRKTLLRLLPGLEFKPSRQYDSSGVNINDYWTESGIKLVWNLLNLIAAPANITAARSQESLEAFRRIALNMTVLTQVHVSYRGILDAWGRYDTARHLSAVNERLYRHTEAGQQSASMSEVELIRRDADRILYNTRRDIAYADLQNAVGDLLVSLGVDPVPGGLSAPDMKSLEQAFAGLGGDIPGITLAQTGAAPTAAGRPYDPDLATPVWVIETAPVDPATAAPRWEILSDVGQGGNPADDIARPQWEILITPAPEPSSAPGSQGGPAQEPHGQRWNGPGARPLMASRAFGPAAAGAAAAIPEGYVIRLGFFSQGEYARDLEQWLARRRLPWFSRRHVANGLTGELVYAGPFDALADARQRAQALRRELDRSVFLFHIRPDGAVRTLSTRAPTSDS